MDIRSLQPLPSLSLQQCHVWLTQAWPIVGLGTLNLVQALSEAALQSNIEGGFCSNIEQLAQNVVEWGHHHHFWEDHTNGGTTFSLNGVAFLNARFLPRTPPKQSWDEFARAYARTIWLNNAPEHLFPFRICDILLFGSMTKIGQRDHGDCDGVLVYETKSESAVWKAQALFQSAPFRWARPLSSIASYRHVMHKTINAPDASHSDPFCRLVTDSKTLEVLLDADPCFSIVSTTNRQWDVDLYATQLDEIFDVVQAAQKNAAMEQCAHVFSSIKASERRFQGFSLENCAQQEILPLLQKFPLETEQQNFVVWWASLGGPELLRTMLDQVDPKTLQKWNAVIDDIPCIAGIWDQSQVQRKNIKENYKNL